MTHVAMAIIGDATGSVLVAKRNRAKRFGCLWEFPGGKLEAGESASTAIKRELREELCITVRVLEALPPYVYDDDGKQIVFHPVRCSVSSGVPRAIEHEEIRYVAIEKLPNLEFAPPDYELVEHLVSAS